MKMTRLLAQAITLVSILYAILTYEFFEGILKNGLLQNDHQLRTALIIGIVIGWIALIKPFINANKFLSRSPIYRYMK